MLVTHFLYTFSRLVPLSKTFLFSLSNELILAKFVEVLKAKLIDFPVTFFSYIYCLQILPLIPHWNHLVKLLFPIL